MSRGERGSKEVVSNISGVQRSEEMAQGKNLIEQKISGKEERESIVAMHE